MVRQLAGLLAVLTAIAGDAVGLELQPAMVSHSVAVTGEPVELSVLLRNDDSLTIARVTAELLLPPGWRADPVRVEIPALAPFTSQRLRFRIVADEPGHGGGRVMVSAPDLLQPLMTVFALSSCRPLQIPAALGSMRERSMGEVPDTGTVYVATGSYIIFIPSLGSDRGAGLVYVRDGYQWNRVATFPALGRVIYDDLTPDGEAVRAEHWVFAKSWWVPRDPVGDYLMTLKDTWQDFRGRTWIAKAFFGPTTDPRVIKCTHALWCSGDAVIRRFEGPMLAVGDGTFRTRHTEILPPMALDDPSQPILVREGLVEQGAMAVGRPGGGVIGLLWDPEQLWTSGKSRPQAVMAVPNQVLRRENQYLTLLAPHYGPRQPASALHAEPGMVQPGRRPIYLRSELLVAAEGGVAEVASAWSSRFGAGGEGFTRVLPPIDDMPTR
ncbi:MAG: hypothetical protein HUU35_03515 [Armatimonadetes bacterium]|nr:hypothetical protein [Armatimonadota bacterium]